MPCQSLANAEHTRTENQTKRLKTKNKLETTLATTDATWRCGRQCCRWWRWRATNDDDWWTAWSWTWLTALWMRKNNRGQHQLRCCYAWQKQQQHLWHQSTKETTTTEKLRKHSAQPQVTVTLGLTPHSTYVQTCVSARTWRLLTYAASRKEAASHNRQQRALSRGSRLIIGGAALLSSATDSHVCI